MKVIVDTKLCDGHSQCVFAAPEVFELADDADQATVLQERPPEALRAQVAEAAAVCPVAAIRIED